MPKSANAVENSSAIVDSGIAGVVPCTAGQNERNDPEISVSTVAGCAVARRRSGLFGLVTARS